MWTPFTRIYIIKSAGIYLSTIKWSKKAKIRSSENASMLPQLHLLSPSDTEAALYFRTSPYGGSLVPPDRISA